METRIPRLRSLVPTVAFVLVCLAATVLLWRAFGGATPLEPRGYRVNVPLGSAPNLFSGSDVRIAGISVGRVKQVRRVGGHAEAELVIQPRYAPLRVGTKATLRSKTLLGEGYLALLPGSRAEPAIRDGGTLRAIDVVSPQRLDDVIGAFDAPTRRRLGAVFTGFARATDGSGEHLNRALGSLPGATEGLGRTLRTVNDQGRNLQALIANGGTVVSALGRRQGALQTAISSAGDVFAVTAQHDEALRRTLRALPPFLVSLRGSARSLAAADADLRPAAKALAAAAPEVRPALAEIARSAPAADRLFKDLRRATPEITKALPAVGRIVRAAGPSLDEVHPVLREIQPVLELLTTVRDSAVTTFAGVGQIHNGTFVAENGRVQHYANGIITVWNESIGGWVKRLPSNRGNTYPKPGFLDNIATGLESFDCEHLRNPPYLPPFGGTPPCKTQGAWTYDGQTKYYPTLQPAPP